MGWWTQDEHGHSFVAAKGEPMMWGDGPADIIDNALAEIGREFVSQYGRLPTKAELRAGLEFSLRGILEERR